MVLVPPVRQLLRPVTATRPAGARPPKPRPPAQSEPHRREGPRHSPLRPPAAVRGMELPAGARRQQPRRLARQLRQPAQQLRQRALREQQPQAQAAHPPPERAHSALAQPPTRPAHPQPPAPALPGSAPPAPKHLPPHLQPEPAAPMRPAQEKQSAPRRRPQATREQSAERQRTVEPCRGTAHLGLGAGSAVAVRLRTRAGQITPALAMVVIVRLALRDMDSRFPRDDVSRRRYRVAIVTQANDSGRYRTVAKERQSGDHPSMGHIRSVAPNQIWLATYRGNLETHTALELSVGTVNGCKIASVACERVAGFEPASTALQAGA